MSVFPRELYQAPRSWAERAYPNLIYFNEVDRGNHFAAWQEPEVFTTEVRAAFRSLRDRPPHQQPAVVISSTIEVRPSHVDIPDDALEDG